MARGFVHGALSCDGKLRESFEKKMCAGVYVLARVCMCVCVWGGGDERVIKRHERWGELL